MSISAGVTFCADCGHELNRHYAASDGLHVCATCSNDVAGTQPAGARIVDTAEATTPSTEIYGVCQICNRAPAITLDIRSTGGYIVYRTMKTTGPITLCRECGLAALSSAQKRATIGVATINLFAPYAIAQNQKWIMRLKRLPTPQHTFRHVTPQDNGQKYRPFSFDVRIAKSGEPFAAFRRCKVRVIEEGIQLEFERDKTLLRFTGIRRINFEGARFYGADKALLTMEDGDRYQFRTCFKSAGSVKDVQAARVLSCRDFVDIIGPIIEGL